MAERGHRRNLVLSHSDQASCGHLKGPERATSTVNPARWTLERRCYSLHADREANHKPDRYCALGINEAPMKPDRECWWSLFLLLFLCSPALPQTVALSEHGSNAFEDLGRVITTYEAIAPRRPEADGQPSSLAPQSKKPAQTPYGWHIAVYPLLAWVPIFDASVTLPLLPSQPIAPSGSTDRSLNGAYFGGARFEQGKWSAEALFMWAALSAKRETPFAKVNLDLVFGDVIGGREVFQNLFVEGGVRRLALDIHATVRSSSASRSPSVWDPLVGLTYRRQLGNKWRILIHGDGGGFGVGSDVDVSATGRAEWQFARHFGVTMGYGGMHLSESNTEAGRTLKISPTLHGPMFGFGIFF